MTIKIKGDLIKKSEQFRASPYKCQAGVWTIGYGTTIYPSGVHVKETDEPITEEVALEYLNDYINKEVKPAIEKLPNADKLKQPKIEALASLIYNIGPKAFNKSTLRTAIINNDKKLIFKNWDWISANGKTSDGLINRRLEELTMWFSVK